jgi:hypothetical protein
LGNSQLNPVDLSEGQCFSIMAVSLSMANCLSTINWPHERDAKGTPRRFEAEVEGKVCGRLTALPFPKLCHLVTVLFKNHNMSLISLGLMILVNF